MIENNYNKRISEITSINSGDFGYCTEYVIVKNREDLRKIIEEPCLLACLALYDKNIQTVNSSANKREIGGQAYIGINYDSLDENNKKILDKLILDGVIEPLNLSDNPNKRGGRDVMIKVPIFENDTVGKVSDRFMQIVSNFQQQDVLYGMYDEASLLESVVNIYGELLHPDENGNVDFEEVLNIITIAYGYVYDEELHTFWATQDLCDKHRKYQKEKESKIQGTIDK
ncbi:MAG: hypothetical protein HFJ28_00695 [Clostridia bacterium]|jgi:hypothetical protein|nr:hypothetical protein [Clostridia bacterium]